MVIHQPVRILSCFLRFWGVTLSHGSGATARGPCVVSGVPAPVCGAAQSAPLKSAPPAQSAPAAGAECAGAGAKVRRFLRRFGALCAAAPNRGFHTTYWLPLPKLRAVKAAKKEIDGSGAQRGRDSLWSGEKQLKVGAERSGLDLERRNTKLLSAEGVPAAEYTSGLLSLIHI